MLMHITSITKFSLRMQPDTGMHVLTRDARLRMSLADISLAVLLPRKQLRFVQYVNMR